MKKMKAVYTKLVSKNKYSFELCIYIIFQNWMVDHSSTCSYSIMELYRKTKKVISTGDVDNDYKWYLLTYTDGR